MTSDPRILRAQELNFSRLLNVHRVSEYPVVKEAITRILNQVIETSGYGAANQPKYKSLLRDHVRVFTLDLYLAYKTDPDYWIAVSLHRDSFALQSRYKALHLGYRPTKLVVDTLEVLGFIERAPGQYYRDGSGRKGHVTRIKATSAFIQLIEAPSETLRIRNRVQPLMISRQVEEEVIILRDQDRKNIEYEDTDLTRQIRGNLKRINYLLEETHINLRITDAEYNEIRVRMRRDRHEPNNVDHAHQSPVIDLSRKRLKRVFNNSSFEQGGRFYGVFWQEIPKEYRLHIRINGRSTVEVDYSGMHFAMLYALVGVELDGDPYQLEGFTRSEDRSRLKRILNIMLNAATEVSAIRAMRDVISIQDLPDGYSSYRDVVAALKQRHRAIQNYFSSGYGVTLQCLDSKIAEAVMLQLLEQRIPVLPVHDSFIVRQADRDVLIATMKEEYRRLLGGDPQTDQGQTVFDLIECTEAPDDMDTLLRQNLEMLNDLRANRDQEYLRYQEYESHWYELRS